MLIPKEMLIKATELSVADVDQALPRAMSGCP